MPNTTNAADLERSDERDRLKRSNARADSPVTVERRQRKRPEPEKVYGAIDLGTNNCRLLIASPVRGGLRAIDSFSRIVRLGEGLSASGRLSETSQDRAVAALKQCANKLERRGVQMVRSVATEACRRAENTAAFVTRVYEETGIALDVITPQEEARLAALGCESLLDRQANYGLVFDIGGGSTELVLVELCPTSGRPAIAAWTSIPWGVTSLHETFRNDHGNDSDYSAMRACVVQEVTRFAESCRALGIATLEDVQLLGTSGTVTTLASVHLGLQQYDRRQVDGCIVPSAAMREITSSLSTLTVAERAGWACIGPDRADLVLAGCAILDAVLSVWPCKRLRVADRGIREGILRLLIRHDAAMLAAERDA